MGKYMKKGKITGDVAVMEVPQSTSLGVRTRARTLALQPNPELSYLQLRNRRLEKPQFQQPTSPKQDKQKQCVCSAPNSKSNSRLLVGSVNSMSAASVSVSCSRRKEEMLDGINESGKASVAAGARREVGDEAGEGVGSGDLGVEASFGENNLDFDGAERSTRESTPCSFIRAVDTMGTPCSAVRPTYSSSTNPGVRNTVQPFAPTKQELDEFFVGFELQQHKSFMEKYNFDIFNDKPLPGRYEWERIDP